MLCRDNHVIVIGAQKAGTTWIQHALDSDSRICTSKEQEVHFFDRESVPDFEVYCRIFTASSECFASADVTPDYLDAPKILPALQEFQRSFSFDPKIVVILRDPVQRAFSAYQMFLNYGKQLGKFSENLAPGNSIFEKSLYGKHLEKWLAAGYGPRMHVILFDDLVDCPNEVLRSLSTFMGLDSPVSGSYIGHSINAGGIDRCKTLSSLRRSFGSLLRDLGMHRLIHAMKRSAMIKLVDRANKKKLVLNSGTKEQAKDPFRSDVDLLDRLFPDLEVKRRWGYERCSANY